MSFKTKVKLLILCVAALTLSLFCAGCIGEMSAWDFLEGQNAMQGVTYYANGGWFGESGSSKDTVSMYYKENANIISDDFTSTGKKDYLLIRPGFTFLGWYKAKVDENGNPVYDANNKLQITGEPADLSAIKKGEHRYVCAEWSQNELLLIKLVSDGAVTLDKAITVNGEEFAAEHVFNPGDDIASAIFTTSGTVALSGVTVAECKGHTFLQFYKDESCTEPIDKYTRGDKGETEGQDSVIYAKYITGKYTIVKTAADVATMFNKVGEGGSYYFFNADSTVKEIDMTGRTVGLKLGDFNIKIEGNGFTLKNLTYKPGRSAITNGSSYSMLGRLTESASIKNLTLQDTTIDVSIRNDNTVHFYALLREAQQGAVLENFAVKGMKLTMTVPDSSVVENIPKTESGYNYDNWLFGGEGSDAAFLQRFTGVTVENNQIEVKAR